MAHYFDDVFHRGTSSSTPKKPILRRSSTNRSIGNRSDFHGSIEDEAELNELRSPTNSVGADHFDREREKERHEADVHTANYVSNELQRVRSNDDRLFEINVDEFEAQLDENGHAFENGDS